MGLVMSWWLTVFLLSADGVDTNAFDKFTNSILEVLDSEEGSGKDLSVKHRFF